MDGCIEWAGSRDDQGYGRRKVAGKWVGAHRVAWSEVHGPIPAGMCICHHCDNPPCVNVEHLFCGTPRDNVLDAFRKGRHSGFTNLRPGGGGRRPGYRSPSRKLTDAQAAEVRASALPERALAVLFGVTKSTIHRIRKGRRYRQAVAV